jgi:predicted ABC-type ATPase
MDRPGFFFVAGCNAAGKSSFIRTRFNQFSDFEIIMTDVYKNRSREVCREALSNRLNVVLETPFNNDSFVEFIELARQNGYYTSLIVLFLDNPQHSIERVANRVIEQNGLHISGDNIKWNFSESFKNVANYFLYFDRTDFIYTGIAGKNEQIMSFRKGEIARYKNNELEYPQKFAHFSHSWHRLNEASRNVIFTNQNYENFDLTQDRPDELDRGYGFSY